MYESLFTERGLSLERLKVLLEVYDAGSIAQAAPGDAVRHSQYSRQLRELSEFFGCEVAERRGKVLKLTTEGARLANIAREFLCEMDDFYTECRKEKIAFNIGAGDSLIQWLVIPRLGKILKKLPKCRLGTASLRTNEIVSHIADSRIDFGLVRKNAVFGGMKSFSLGTLSYVAVVPHQLLSSKRTLTHGNFFADFPLAMQTTDGQFTSQLREVALGEKSTFNPKLACQSFPQVFAAVKSGEFAAILPELSTRELPSGFAQILTGGPLRKLQREISLIWNPRLIKVRPRAADLLAHLQTVLHF